MGSAAVLIGSRMKAATPACTLTAEQEIGPYYIDYEKVRQEITEGHPGLPVRLQIALVDSKSCAPLPNAALDIWHCDAAGVYSGFTGNSPDGPGGPPGADAEVPAVEVGRLRCGRRMRRDSCGVYRSPTRRGSSSLPRFIPAGIQGARFTST